MANSPATGDAAPTAAGRMMAVQGADNDRLRLPDLQPAPGRKPPGWIPVLCMFFLRSQRGEGAPRSAASRSWPELLGARASWPGLPGMLAACLPGSRREGAPDVPIDLLVLACWPPGARGAGGGRAGPGRGRDPGRDGQRRVGRLHHERQPGYVRLPRDRRRPGLDRAGWGHLGDVHPVRRRGRRWRRSARRPRRGGHRDPAVAHPGDDTAGQRRPGRRHRPG